MCLFQTTLEAIQSIQSLYEESVSFKGLIQTKYGLEDFQSLTALLCRCLKNKAIEEPPFPTFGC